MNIATVQAIGFQSTLPAWGETHRRREGADGGVYFNPLSPHGERQRYGLRFDARITISIHSPRMGRDPRRKCSAARDPPHFNPLSPHGERPPPCSWNDHIGFISIHSPRMGRDLNVSGRRTTSPFQSTLPAWGETFFPFCPSDLRDISIHSPRMGRDQIVVDYFNSHMDNFNPLSPQGRDPIPPFPTEKEDYFNPLSPHGERRRRRIHHAQHEQISIHSPRMGRDCGYWRRTACTVGFQSTLPAWGETPARFSWLILWPFQSTLPAWGETVSAHVYYTKEDIFQSTLPAWGETIGAGGLCDGGQYFNPLSPHGERRQPEDYKTPTKPFQSTLPAWGET